MHILPVEMARIRAEGHDVPFCVPCNSEGVGSITAILLSVRYNLVLESVHLEEEIVNDDGELIQTVYQMPIRAKDGREWLLEARRYVVRGLTADRWAASTEILTPGRSMTSTVDVGTEPNPPVKQPVAQRIHVLSESDKDDFVTPSQAQPSSSQKPVSGSFSVIPGLMRLFSKPGARNALSRLDFRALQRDRVPFLPTEFNGDVLFELPPIPDRGTAASAKSMAGMDKKYDAHPWCKTMTTNITNDQGLTFRYSVCAGHLKCQNEKCDFLLRGDKRKMEVNESEWDGVTLTPFVVGCDPPPKSTLVCKICRYPPECIATCPARMYYVLGNPAMSRACIHIGTHNHPVGYVECRETKQKVLDLLELHMQNTPYAKTSALALEASKDFLSEYLLTAPGEKRTILSDEELDEVFKKYYTLSKPGLKNAVTTFRGIGNLGIIDGIAALRGCSKWEFIHDNKFPGQGSEGDKVFIFKMSEKGPGSGVDLVKRMQPGGDLQDSWIMFDHVKRTKGWTTMACHVYDSQYCRVMTIAICDMQSEDVRAQTVMWQFLNGIMAKHGYDKVNFKGFMADSAQANWNCVRKIYGSGDATVPMPDRERTCQFHWATSLRKHTEAHIIGSDLQRQHYVLCKQYRDAKNMEEADIRFHAIRAWWTSSGATTASGLRDLELWLVFWHFRYRQWGGFMQLVSTTSLFLSSHLIHLFDVELIESAISLIAGPYGRREGRDALLQPLGDCAQYMASDVGQSWRQHLLCHGGRLCQGLHAMH